MTKRIGSLRTGTRHTLAVPKRQKGRLSIGRFLQKLEIGDRVALKAAPSVQKGLYHHRFHGKTGRVVGFQNKHCEVAVRDKNKEKTVVVNPVHLMRIKNGAKTK